MIKYTIHSKLMTVHELWNSIIFSQFQNVISNRLTTTTHFLHHPPPPLASVIMTHCVQKATSDSPLSNFISTFRNIYIHLKLSKLFSFSVFRVKLISNAMHLRLQVICKLDNLRVLSKAMKKSIFISNNVFCWFRHIQGIFKIYSAIFSLVETY